MPKQSYALEAGGEKRLNISWKGMFKDVNVTLDGDLLGVIPNQKALIEGQAFALPDGSNLNVQLIRKMTNSELQILRDGLPLPGSASDPKTKVKTAKWVVFFIAALNLLLGLVSFLFNIEFLQLLGIGFGSIIFGLVFLALGFFVNRNSMIALVLAIIFFILDTLVGSMLTILAGGSPGIGGVLFRIILLIPMFQGVGALKELKSDIG